MNGQENKKIKEYDKTELSKNEHIVELAQELLDDIELSRCSSESLILKARRLARLIGDNKVQNWLFYEMHGYHPDSPYALEYISLTGRWIDYEKKTAYCGSLSDQEAVIHSTERKLECFRIPPNSHPTAVAHLRWAIEEASNLLSRISSIRSRVLALLYSFASDTYYNRIFSNLSETIFENYKREVDKLLSTQCGNIIEMIPSIYNRLTEKNPEAISQAQSTCRRIIDSFADSMYPPTKDKIIQAGEEHDLSQDKPKNRILAYINENTKSEGRQKKLRQTLENIYERLSAGVHDDITFEEAKSLFLQTYLFLGEVLNLKTL